VRRLPRDPHSGHIDYAELACASLDSLSQQAVVSGPVIVKRESPPHDAAALLLGRESFGDVNETSSQISASAPSGQSRSAYARGPPLLSEAAGGAPEHTTLVAALEANAACAVSADRGISYINVHGAVEFESYASLLTEARSLLGALRRTGLERGCAVALQV
jgi:hypothetical protein